MLTIAFLSTAPGRAPGYGAFLAGWYWSGSDLDGMEYRDVGPFLSRANATADAADCGVRNGFRSTARRAYPMEPTWGGAAIWYDIRRQRDYHGVPFETESALIFPDGRMALPLPSLPFDPIYLGA